jgi:prepilin-type N-terminal cleavage/methylation domain-containing protein/prepilin-type processing-associated H-X9-DG protein
MRRPQFRPLFTSRSRRGFTLVEMLVVIAIIVTLAAMLLPAVQKARAAAARAKCMNNLRQIALACHNYHDSFKHFPAGVTGDLNQNRGWGWGAQLLPFVDQASLAQNIDLTQPFAAGKPVPNGIGGAGTVPATAMWVPVYVCPSDTSAPVNGFSAGGMTLGPSSYAAICGSDATAVETATSSTTANGIFYVDSATTIEGIKDGSSQTALVGEKAWGWCESAWAGVPSMGGAPGYAAPGIGQAGPENTSNPGATFDGKRMVMSHCHLINIQGPDSDGSGGTDDLYSNHPAGANVAFADGHVSFIKSIPYDPNGGYSQDSISWQALGTRAAGDAPATGFDY